MTVTEHSIPHPARRYLEAIQAAEKGRVLLLSGTDKATRDVARYILLLCSVLDSF
jgi:hypothetical protein